MTNEIDISKYLTDKYEKSQNNYGICVHCNTHVEWRTERVKNHFFKSCKTAPLELKERFRNSKKRKALSTISYTTEASCSNFSEMFPEDSVSTTHRTTKIIEHFRVVTDAFIEKVNETGISFNVADSESFIDIFKEVSPGYKPPTSKVLRTTLLEITSKNPKP